MISCSSCCNIICEEKRLLERLLKYLWQYERMYRPRTYSELLEALGKQIDAVVADPSPTSLNSLILKIKILKDALKRGYGTAE